MPNKVSQIKIIGYGLLLLYLSSLLIYLKSYNVPQFEGHAKFLSFLFLLLVISSGGVVLLKEWGRKSIILMNIILAVYALRLYFLFPEFIPMSYVLISIVIFIFFMSSKIKVGFAGGEIKRWQSILIIDDDETLVKTIRPILISNGYSVLTANSGEAGLLVIEKQKPDLIILDVILPGIKGRDVCKKIKDNPATRHIPVCFLTAKDSKDDIQAEIDVGAETHLTKPVNTKELLATIKNILSK